MSASFLFIATAGARLRKRVTIVRLEPSDIQVVDGAEPKRGDGWGSTS